MLCAPLINEAPTAREFLAVAGLMMEFACAFPPPPLPWRLRVAGAHNAEELWVAPGEEVNSRCVGLRTSMVVVHANTGKRVQTQGFKGTLA